MERRPPVPDSSEITHPAPRDTAAGRTAGKVPALRNTYDQPRLHHRRRLASRSAALHWNNPSPTAYRRWPRPAGALAKNLPHRVAGHPAFGGRVRDLGVLYRAEPAG